MNICYLANSRFPSERAHMTQIVQMCNAFSLNGHTVTLLVTDRKTGIQESPEEYFGVPLRFSYERVSVPDIAGRSPRIPRVLHPYAFLIQRAVFAYRALVHIRHHDYTHIYGRDEWILWLVSVFASVPVVFESHEARYSFGVRMLIRSKALRALVVISEGIYDFYRGKGVSRERMLVAHDAVDERFFEKHVSSEDARHALGIASAEPVVMYIGGLEAWKGSETLFEATRGRDDFSVYVVGGKESELADSKKRHPHVHFLGPRPYRELPMVQQAADVLVIPNTGTNALSRLYTSPLKLFSYMTSKKPILASRIPSITNVLGEDEAFFFAPDDEDDLLRTLQVVLSNPREADTRAQRAYKKSTEYTWQNRAVMISSFLNTKTSTH